MSNQLSGFVFLAVMLVILVASQFLGHHLERKRDKEKADLRRAGDDHYLDRLHRIVRPVPQQSVDRASAELQAAIDHARQALKDGGR